MAPTGNHTSRAATLLIIMLLLSAGAGLAVPGCENGSGVVPVSAPDITTAVGSDAEVSLRYLYSPGDTWVHEATTVAKSTVDAALMTGGEGSVVTEETTKERRTATAQEVADDGTATLSMRFETVERTLDGAAQDLTTEEPHLTTIIADEYGKVASVAGSDDSAVTSGSFDSAGVSQFFEYLDYNYDLTAVLYPEDGKAGVGDEWSSDYAIPLAGMGKELTVSTTAKLISVSTEDGRQVAVIEHSSKLPMEVTLDLSAYYRAALEGSSYAGDLTILVVKMTAAGEITYTGVSRIDTATGRLMSGEGDSTISMKLAYTEAPEDLLPSDQRGPFAMDATGIVTIVEVN
jgi:hypothetical protein